MSKKIIFFDIDGTLYCPENGKVTDIVKKSIDKTREKGHLCFIASGRPYGFIAQNIKDIGFDGYILANGANIKYHDEDLKVRYLCYEDVKDLITKLKSHHIEYVLQTTELCYLDKHNECLLEFYRHCNVDFKNFCFDYDEDEIMHKVVKIEVWVKNEEELEYAKSCYGPFSYELHPDQHSMEVYSKTVSKATGVEDVLNLFNLSLEDSYCFGDGPNDVEMFETIGYPIAMGNAIDIIKEKAKEVCLSVQEDGVAYKLTELFDIEI